MNRINNYKRRFITSRRTTNVTNNNSAIEVRAGSVKGFTIWRIKVELAAATATTLGLGIPAAIGVTPTAPVGLTLMQDVGDTQPADGLTTTALAWGTSPTNPTTFVERISLPAAIGAAREIFFTDGFYVAKGSSFVVQNLAANGALDVTFEISE
jgi:hypothetical protein